MLSLANLGLVIRLRIAGHLGSYASIYDRIYHPDDSGEGFCP